MGRKSASHQRRLLTGDPLEKELTIWTFETLKPARAEAQGELDALEEKKAFRDGTHVQRRENKNAVLNAAGSY